MPGRADSVRSLRRARDTHLVGSSTVTRREAECRQQIAVARAQYLPARVHPDGTGWWPSLACRQCAEVRSQGAKRAAAMLGFLELGESERLATAPGLADFPPSQRLEPSCEALVPRADERAESSHTVPDACELQKSGPRANCGGHTGANARGNLARDRAPDALAHLTRGRHGGGLTRRSGLSPYLDLGQAQKCCLQRSGSSALTFVEAPLKGLRDWPSKPRGSLGRGAFEWKGRRSPIRSASAQSWRGCLAEKEDTPAATRARTP
jgi:hypothetical protein